MMNEWINGYNDWDDVTISQFWVHVNGKIGTYEGFIMKNGAIQTFDGENE